jgi:hypothetical protein
LPPLHPLRLRPGSRLMQELLLFTRQGCCLCEGLEDKLRALDPPQPLQLIDVDTDPALQGRYGLAVPVLAVAARGEPSCAPGGPALS